MPRITISLNLEIAAWVRAEAAEQKLTASRFIEKLLNERREYLRAMERYFSLKPLQLGEPGEPLPKRADLYEERLRRYGPNRR
mgnify:CR=1 FL=1